MRTINKTDIEFKDYDLKYFQKFGTFNCGSDKIYENINKFLKVAGHYPFTTKLVFVGNELAAYISYRCSSVSFNLREKDGEYICEEQIPAIEIGFYAVDCNYQGEKAIVQDIESGKETKFSAFIFNSFLLDLFSIAQNNVCAVNIVLFSINQKKNLKFFKKVGFKELPTDQEMIKNDWDKDCIPMFTTIPSKAEIDAILDSNKA